MAIKTWTGGQLAVFWGALVLLSAWVAASFFLSGDLGGSWFSLWILTLGPLGLPGLVVTWRWMGRESRGPDTCMEETADVAAGGAGERRNPLRRQRAIWIVGLAITGVAGLQAATGDTRETLVLLGETVGYVLAAFGIAGLFLGWSSRTRAYMPVAMAALGILLTYGSAVHEAARPNDSVLRGGVTDTSSQPDRLERLRERLQAISDSVAVDTTKGPSRP